MGGRGTAQRAGCPAALLPCCPAALLLGYEALHAPAHWRAEAVNVFWARLFPGELTEDDARDRMALLMRAPVIDARLGQLMSRAFDISAAAMVTIDDALYVALAEQLGIDLVPTDQKLIRRLTAGPHSRRA